MAPKRILLIPGWAASGAAMAPLTAKLADHSIDMPDFSRVTAPSDFVPAVLDALGEEPAVVVGWSMGATLGIEAALARPEQVTGLVSISGTPRFVSDDPRKGWREAILQRLIRRIRRDPIAALEAFRRQMFTSSEGTPCEAYMKVASTEPMGGCTSVGLVAGLEYLRDSDFTESVTKLPCPVLWIHGDADPICPAGCLDLLPDRFMVFSLEGVGHVPLWTAPEVVVQTIRNFVSPDDKRV